MEVMLKDILGPMKPPREGVSTNKVKGRSNKNDKESDGGEEVEDPPVKKMVGKTILTYLTLSVVMRS